MGEFTRLCEHFVDRERLRKQQQFASRMEGKWMAKAH